MPSANPPSAYAVDTTSCTGTDSTAQLNISNSKITDNITAGNIAYGSSNVSGVICNAESYALIISSTSGLEGATAIGNANNQTPANMPNNAWGYSWNDTGADYVAAVYKAVTGGSTLEANTSLNGNASFNKKISFAAKFGENAEGGHYTADVTLSLAATPKEVIGFGAGENKITTMQAMTPEVCNSVSIGDTGVLEDVRDGSRYSIAKLDDNNCWMTRNLELTKEGIIAKGGENNSTKLTSVLSNVAEDSTFIMPDSIEAINTTSPADFSYEIDYNSVAQIYDNGHTNSSWKPGYGAYYNFYAASAGTGNSTTMTKAGQAVYDICPKGWKLPSASDYDGFITAIGIQELTTVAEKYAEISRYFEKAGYLGPTYSSGGGHWTGPVRLAGVGSSGRYLSSNFIARDTIRLFGFDSSNVKTIPSNPWYGSSVRCIAASNTESSAPVVSGFAGIEKMQDMTPQTCGKATNNSTGELYDTRDNATYTVKRVSNLCWMTQNLRIVDKAITSADSNVSADFTIPASALWTDTSSTNPHAYYNDDTTYGAYYNWYTATAGANPSSGVAPSSICPKGWRLPTQAEYNTIASSSLIYNFVTSGYVNAYSGALSVVGSDGYYWSSTANGNDSAYRLDFYGNSASVGGDGKHAGLSARCVTTAIGDITGK